MRSTVVPGLLRFRPRCGLLEDDVVALSGVKITPAVEERINLDLMRL